MGDGEHRHWAAKLDHDGGNTGVLRLERELTGDTFDSDGRTWLQYIALYVII